MKNSRQAFFVIASMALLFAPIVAGAQFTVPADGTGGLTNTTVFKLISNVLNWMLGIIGVLAVIAFVIAGVMYLTSAGNTEQADKAKNVMLYAIIGLVVALLGLVIVNAVAGLTGAAGGTAY